MEENYTVKTALRWIVETYSRNAFQKEMLINGILADLVKEQEAERRKIRLALSSGAGKHFYQILLRTDGNLQSQDVRMFRTKMADCGFTDEFTNYVLNTFLFAASLPEINLSSHANGTDNRTTTNGRTEDKNSKSASSPDLPLVKILEIARGYQDMEDYQREIYLLESVLDRYPNVPGIYNMLGIAYRNTDRNSQALLYYQKALDLEPDNGIYLLNKAIALATSGFRDNVKESLMFFEKSLPILQKISDQEYAKALGNYSYALALDGQTEKAVAALETAAKLGYRHAETMRAVFKNLRINCS